ncbi:helix-turn-helix domain-containing protein [Chromohalobacter canadensis]|uniref:helix-turn-helix domain-containing protein n=1 Tax=Chromohalobacter canadensis TaxID=141389 RepID=UPI0024107804|nr:helix-turn-helix transcriptional regulator [Chromohalobacter canadensis]
MDALGPRIKQLRIDAGLSKAALARRVGVSDVTISYWESGTIKQVGHERLIALADALHCPLERLLEDSTAVATPTASQRITEDVLGNARLLALHTMPPVPWEAHTLAAPLPASGTAIDALVRGCHLVTPGAGETFAYLEEGDIAAIRPTSSFQQEGLYLLEWRHALMIQYLSQPEPETLRIVDPSHSTTVDPNQPFPFRIAGRLQARWKQRNDSD